MAKRFWVMYIAAFLDLCGVSMIVIHLPTHLLQLGTSHSATGYIVSIYGFVQFFSSPIVGRYADRKGKRSVLLLCIALCGVGYLLLGHSTALWIIVLLRIHLGIFKHPLNIIKSALSDLTLGDAEMEAEVQGYYQSACSIAFIVGPPLGGHLMELPSGFTAICTCVCFVYAVNSVLIILWLNDALKPPPTSGNPRNLSFDNNRPRKTEDGWTSIRNVLDLADPTTRTLCATLLMRFLLGFSGLMFRSCYALIYKEFYSLSHTQVGYAIAFNAVVQAGTGLIMKYIAIVIPSSRNQLVMSCAIYSSAVTAIACCSSQWSLVMLIVLLSVSTMISKVSASSFTFERVERCSSATLVGTVESLMSLARLLAPIASGLIVESFGLASPLYLTAGSTILAAWLAILVDRQLPKLKTT